MNYQKAFIDLEIDWFHASGLFEAGLNDEKDSLSKLRGQNASVAIISDGIYAEHEGLCGLNIIKQIIGTNEIPIVSVGPHPGVEDRNLRGMNSSQYPPDPGIKPGGIPYYLVSSPGGWRSHRCLQMGQKLGDAPLWNSAPTGDAVRGTAMAGILAGRSLNSRIPAINQGCYSGHFPLNYLFPSGVGTNGETGSFCPLTLSGHGFGDQIASGYGIWMGGSLTSENWVNNPFDTSHFNGPWEKDILSELPIWKKPFRDNPDALTLFWNNFKWDISINTGDGIRYMSETTFDYSFIGNPIFIGSSCTGCPLGPLSFIDFNPSHIRYGVHPLGDGYFNAVIPEVPVLSECPEVVGQNQYTGEQGMIEGMASQISVLYDYPYLYKSYLGSLSGDYHSKMSQSLTRLLEILNSVKEKAVDVLIMDLNPSVYPISSGSFYGLSTEIREGLKNKIIEIASAGTTIILTDAEFPHDVNDDQSYPTIVSYNCSSMMKEYDVEFGSKNFLLDSLMPEIRPHIITLSKMGRSAHPQDPRWPPFDTAGLNINDIKVNHLENTLYSTGFLGAQYSDRVAGWGEARMINNGLCFPGNDFTTFLPGVPIFDGRPTSLPPENIDEAVARDLLGPIPGPYRSILTSVDILGSPGRETSHLSAAIAGGVAAIIHGFKRNSEINKLNVIETMKGCVYPIDEYNNLILYPHNQSVYQYLYAGISKTYGDNIFNDNNPADRTAYLGYNNMWTLRSVSLDLIEKDIYIKPWNKRYGYGTTNFKLLARTLSSYLVGLNPIGDDHQESGTSVQMMPCQREWMKKYFPEEPYIPEFDLSDINIIGRDNTRSGWPDVGWPPFSIPEKNENFNEGVTASRPESQPSSFVPDLALCADNFIGWSMAVCTGSDLYGFFGGGGVNFWANSMNHGNYDCCFPPCPRPILDPSEFNDKPYWKLDVNYVRQKHQSQGGCIDVGFGGTTDLRYFPGEYIYWDNNIDKWVMSTSLGGAPIEVGNEENPRQAIMDLSPPLCPIGFWAGDTNAYAFTRPSDTYFVTLGQKVTALPLAKL